MDATQDTANNTDKPSPIKRSPSHYDQILIAITVQVECTREYTGTVYVPFSSTFTRNSENIEEAKQLASTIINTLAKAGL